MEVVLFDKEAGKATLMDDRRYIGGDLCVPTGKNGSISLAKKDDSSPPGTSTRSTAA